MYVPALNTVQSVDIFMNLAPFVKIENTNFILTKCKRHHGL